MKDDISQPFTERGYSNQELQEHENLPLSVDVLALSFTHAEADKNIVLRGMDERNELDPAFRSGMNDAVNFYQEHYLKMTGGHSRVALIEAVTLFISLVHVINQKEGVNPQSTRTYEEGHLQGLFLCSRMLDQMIGEALDEHL